MLQKNSHRPDAPWLGTALSLIGAGFITFVGVRYLVTPESMAAEFGLPAAPEGPAAGFLNVKGVRDIGTGAVILALLAARERRALGIATLAIALIPAGDMVTVLARRGSPGTAVGVHGVTAALVAATGGLLLRESRAK
ncbi:DUF4267 domain-containing protein [Nocardia stercoris]|uniref:DUF4267 domain-containing protein n=1 Tax=Nocardia stercoris TaxID=2483361 RepID=A0A3M2LFH7_9NOCA|nr:DUF4267 domain-containing protein [Nocardia stercoris]RMI35570.1 DUF4267 domain-containing protein [Nocardia stercoris]